MTRAAGIATDGRPRWRRPRALVPGDRIAVVAPASPFNPADLEAGIRELRACGFEPVFEDTLFARTGFLAGDPASRAAALTRAWQDEANAAIIAARGGYGSTQVLAYLDPSKFKAKVFIGSSDLTSFQVWLLQRAGIVTFHGPMVASTMSRGIEGYDRDVFVRAITQAEPLGELPAPALETLVPGEAAGPLVGGTLAQLGASLGTPYAFDPPNGCILFLEDVQERPYRLHRLVTQLSLNGMLARAAGIILGTFPGCDEPSFSARDTLAELFASFTGPVVYGLPVGHVDGPALTIPLGVQVRVVAGSSARVIVEEAAVEAA
ncbi:MAG TPA: LD-carboxypeptidase [Vicinamibacterales bacterium]|nr:LD-carboxypeptidase [Vicinamibacterales bacterium]